MKVQAWPFVLPFFLLAVACSGGGGSSSAGGSSGGTGTITGTVSLDDSVSLGLIQGGRALQTPGNVRVYVDDDETLYDDTDASGAFSIPNVPAGTKCIHASASAQNNDTYGFRVCGIAVGSGETAVGAQTLTEAGAISGTVLLDSSTDYQNTQVYVPGTSFAATTDAAGAFVMTGLPAGDYEIAIERDGYVTHEIASVTVASGLTTAIGSLTLLAGESCTDDGAVLAITGVSQSAVSVDVGETATFSVEACSSLDLTIDYEWLNFYGVDLAEGGSFTFTPVAGMEGMTYTFVGKAYIDDNNQDFVTFQLKVNNGDYWELVSKSPESSVSSSVSGKYGDYFYGVTRSGSSYLLDIVDLSDSTEPTQVVDDQSLFSATGSSDEVILKIEESKIVIADGGSAYLYDLAADPLNPSLQGTLSCSEEYCADNSVSYEPVCVNEGEATQAQLQECESQYPDFADDVGCVGGCILQEQVEACDEVGEWSWTDIAYSDGTVYLMCSDGGEVFIYAYDVPASGAPERVGSMWAFSNVEGQGDSNTQHETFTDVYDLAAESGNVYFHGQNSSSSISTLFAFDFSDPANPSYVASYLTSTTGGGDGIYVFSGENRVYISRHNGTNYEIVILDEGLSPLDSIETGTQVADLGFGNGYAWFADTDSYGSYPEAYYNSTHMIHIYDGPDFTTLLGRIDPLSYHQSSFVDDNSFYVLRNDGSIAVYEGL